MIQIIFQTLFLFMILWMILFHDRWENFRDFMTRNYSSDSLIYFCGFLILFAFLLITLGRGFFIWSCVWIWLPCTSYRPRKVQNLILCFTLDMKNWKLSNIRSRIRKLSQQMCKVSEFNFTLLPSAEIYSLEQPRHQRSFFVALSIFIAYLISSIPERPKKFSSNSQ